MHYSQQFGEGVITFHDFLNALRIFMYKMIRIYFANCLLTYQNITIVIFFSHSFSAPKISFLWICIEQMNEINQ